MPLYDSSVLIDYLADEPDAVEAAKRYSDRTAVTVPLVMFEVYQGEVFSPGEPDFDGVDSALSWLNTVDETRAFSREAAVLQDRLNRRGEPLSARDVYVAGAASATGETLVATDSDFDSEALRGLVDVSLAGE